MIADMEVNKTLSYNVIELLTRARKLNNSLVFISQSHIKVRTDIRVNAFYFIIKTPNKR